ncbi:MAG: cupredoxin domain-containing protein [Ktedonobacteraceae bacterium]
MQKYFATSLTKSWFCLLIIGILFTLAACGGSPPAANTSTPTATTAPTATDTPIPTPTTAPTAAPTTAPSGGTSVTVTNFAFSPATITVKVGTTITWTNNTGAPHTVTSDDGTSFDSGINNPIAASGGTYSFTFTKAGTYTYHCQIHPFMKATVVVQ